tara:strand:- start:3614 stop:4330 length:717 start_codon:yes stop_codon:yes gene_type:complete
MKPMQVDAGQYAPDVDEMIEKAGSMIEKIEMDNSQIRNITGVEEAPMNHFHTNQELASDLEDVTNKGASAPESVSFMENANPHQTGSTLDAHENPSGGDPHPPSSYTHSSVGKPPSDVKKQIESILKRSCPTCGGNHKLEKNVSCSVKKAGADPLAALMGGAAGKGPGAPPPGDMDDPLPDMGGKPGEGEDDSPEGLGMKIKNLVDDLVGKVGGGGDMPDLAGLGGGGPDAALPPGPM